MRGLVNIAIGVVFIVGGLSGVLVLRGTKSGVALAVLGGGLVALGLFRMVNSKPPTRKKTRTYLPPGDEPWNNIGP
jgi:hypothetical protein